jgi:hypothetical protein
LSWRPLVHYFELVCAFQSGRSVEGYRPSLPGSGFEKLCSSRPAVDFPNRFSLALVCTISKIEFGRFFLVCIWTTHSHCSHCLCLGVCGYLAHHLRLGVVWRNRRYCRRLHTVLGHHVVMPSKEQRPPRASCLCALVARIDPVLPQPHSPAIAPLSRSPPWVPNSEHERQSP